MLIRMACIEERPRKKGSVTYYVRWIDLEFRTRMSLKVDLKVNAQVLCTVLNAHGNNADAALKTTQHHFSGVYTVTRMIEDHIDLLTLATAIQ